MTSIPLYLDPHCAKYLDYRIRKSEGNIRKNRPYLDLVYLLIEERPFHANPSYSCSRVYEFPVRQDYIKSGNIDLRKKSIYIKPEQMKMLNSFIDMQFREELLIMTAYMRTEMETRSAIRDFFEKIQISEDEFTIENAIKYERRNRKEPKELGISA